jgi:hypothetical protein
VRSQNIEQLVSGRRRVAFDARDRDWPLLTGLGLVVVLLLAVGYAAVSGASRMPIAATMSDQGAQALPAGVAVACGPGQQALLRQVLSAGRPLVLVECAPAAGLAGASALTTAYAPGVTSVAAPAVHTIADDEVVYSAPVRHRVVARRSGRSWQKSAVVIGSSAGVGAAVGAAVGGKKGALIGAAVGGGGAAIWDQVTRNRR